MLAVGISYDRSSELSSKMYAMYLTDSNMSGVIPKLTISGFPLVFAIYVRSEEFNLQFGRHSDLVSVD